MDTDRNLLFATFALRAGYLTRDTFVAGCALWASRPTESIADLLVARGWLSAEDRSAVEASLPQCSIPLATAVAVPDAVPVPEATPVAAEGGTLAQTPVEAVKSAGRSACGGAGPAGPSRYTVSRLHAAGGIGRVWVAADTSVGREVALKDLHPERAADPAVWPRFLREARVTGRLEHPGIVPVYEIGTKPGTGEPFYAMRLVHGETLKETLDGYHRRRRAGGAGPLDLRDLLAAFIAVCHAVAYAHSRGVLHRDLKPQNVVLGKYGEVIVLDWGLARLLEAADDPDATADAEGIVPRDADGVAATVQGSVLGTPAYMAPEQARGELDALGPWTDVYGLGAVLYEILTGRTPFSGTSTAEVLDRVKDGNPRAPAAVVNTVPRPIQAICLKAMAKRPSDRYPSAAALADDVRHALADEPVTAYRAPLLHRTGRWARQHKSLVVALAAAVLVLVVGGTVLGVRQARERERTQAAAALRAEAERSEADRLRGEAERRHAVGLAALRAGDMDRGVAALAEAAGFCQQSPSLAAKQKEIAGHLTDIERFRTFTRKAAAALQSGADPTPPDERTVRRREPTTIRDCEAALAVYGVMARPEWKPPADGVLSPAQAEGVKQTVHELLVTLAAEVSPADARRALDLLDRAGRLVPAGSGVLLLELTCHVHLKDRAAVDRTRARMAAVRDEPQLAQQHYVAGIVALRLRHLKEAEDSFRVATELDPAMFRAHFALFLCRTKAGVSKELLLPLSVCLALHPDDPELYYFRGMTYFNLNQHATALNDFESAIKHDPNYALGYHYRGRMRWALSDDPAGPEADYTRALELDPKLTAARSWRAITRAKMGKHAEAAADAERAVAEEPDEPLTLFYAARAFSQCAGEAGTAGSAQAARYGARSVELLWKATEKGFRGFHRLAPGGDFDPVRGRPDFQEFVKKYPIPKESPMDPKGG